MRHITSILLRKPFRNVKDAGKRMELYKRAKTRWMSFDWKKRTEMHKKIDLYGILGATQ